jgi:Sulfotransferase domain
VSGRGAAVNLVLQQDLKRSAGTPALAAWRRLSAWRRNRATGRTVAARLATASDRLLPNTIILGAQKAGTTTLFALLSRHPCVVTSFTKEVHFFDVHQDRGIKWYRAHFPTTRQAEELALEGLPQAVLEASPYYLFHPSVPDRLAETIPDARFVVLLRDPVVRAWSHYWHERTRGYEWRSPEAAFKREGQRLAGEEERLLADPSYRSHAHRHFSYLSRSRYATQLQRWFARFSRERFLVLRSEDLFAAPAVTVAQTLAFLGLPEEDGSRPPSRDYARNVGDYPPLPSALREELEAQLERSNTTLQTLLGPTFSW